MLYFFEGARGSGKTFLSNEISTSLYYEYFKFEFTEWHNLLSFDTKKEIHTFALGKDIMIYQLNREGILLDCIVDRGIFTVLSWAVLDDRISKEEAFSQLDNFISLDLFKDTTTIFVKGKKDNHPRSKDIWDRFDSVSHIESDLVEDFIDYCSDNVNDFIVYKVENSFDIKTIEEIKKIF